MEMSKQGLHPRETIPEDHPKAVAGKDGFKLPRPPYQKPSELRPYIPLPPCSFQRSPMSISGKSCQRIDPFFAAFIKCTGDADNEVIARNSHKKTGKKKVSRRAMLGFSCKSRLDVAEGAMVELPSSPLVLSYRGQIHGSEADRAL